MKEKKSYNVKIAISLSPIERKKLQDIRRKGKASVRIIKRARILELFDKGYTSPSISEYVGVTAETVRRVGWNYINEGLDGALYDKFRPGKARAISEKQAQQIIAMVCSSPPEGRDRWTVRLIAEEVNARGIAKGAGREIIRMLLKTHDLKPWREKNVVHSGDNA